MRIFIWPERIPRRRGGSVEYTCARSAPWSEWAEDGYGSEAASAPTTCHVTRSEERLATPAIALAVRLPSPAPAHD